MRVNPEPGGRYKLVWKDSSGQSQEKEFVLVNILGNSYEVEVDGERKTVGYLEQLCHPWAGEVHTV